MAFATGEGCKESIILPDPPSNAIALSALRPACPPPLLTAP